MAESAAVEATEPVLSLTAKAVEAAKGVRVKEGRPETQVLRVSVVGGGCSGFSYQLNFHESTGEGDVVYDYAGLRVVVDPTSAQYLAGTEIDFVTSLHGGGFKFTNPKATHTCGCGSSFTA